MAEPSKCLMRVRITFAVIGVLVGLSIFPVFGFVYENWDVAAWGLASGVFAAFTLGIHIRYVQNAWRLQSRWLKPLMYVGCVAQLGAVAAFVAYLALAITEGQSLTPYGRGYYLACVWCFMTWKWGFLMFYFARSYRKLYEKMTGTSSDVPYEKV